MIRVKICGITRAEDAAAAVDAGADALGFVFYPPSKRSVAPERAAAIIAELPPFLHKVGVFVDETAGHIEAVRRQTGITMVQLSGDEDPALVAAIGVPVLKAFRTLPADLARWRVAGMIADGARPGSYGGTGTGADEGLIAGLRAVAPLILAGGLTPDNVAAQIRRWKPYAVDVASGVEAEPGRKDPDKLQGFIHAARAAPSHR